MKQHKNWFAKASATVATVAVGLTMVGAAKAAAIITTYDSFTSDALYGSWTLPGITSTPTNYIITATGYGSNYKYIGFPAIDGTGTTNIQLDITLSGPAGADGQLGPIVTLLDGDGTRNSYRWYGQTLGNHLLNMPINSPTVVEQAGTVAGLDLTTLTHMHMELDPGAFGSSGAYTLAWNNLRLTGPGDSNTPPPPVTGVSVITFDNFTSDALYPSWTLPGVTSGTTNYIVTATGYGSNYKYIGFPAINGAGQTTFQLTVTLSGPAGADGQLGPIVELIDGDGTDVKYAWYGQTLGHHVLTQLVASPTTVVAAGTTPGLDLTTLTHSHISLDPGAFGASGAYTISWEDLSLIGGSSSNPILITSKSYNPANREFTLTWTSTVGKTYTILYSADVATAFGPLVTGVASGGATTTTTVTLPVGATGFVRVQEE